MQIFGYDIGLFYARKVEPPQLEVRGRQLSNPALAEYLGIQSPMLTTAVSNDSILGIPPAWSAIRYISEGIASLNRGVFRRENDGDVFPDHNSPVAQLFDGRPHPHYTTFDFLQALVSNACMGNGYARIHRDEATMRPTALELIPSDYVDIVYSRTGQLFYQINGFLNDQPVSVTLPETDIIHVKGVTFTGVNGKRLNLVHKSSFSTALGGQTYGETWFNQGASVGGLITFPNPLTKEQREVLKAKLEVQHLGAKNAGSMMVLDAGADFKPVQAGPKDAAVIDFSNLSTIAVSQIFKVPLHLLSQLDRSTFSNMEQQNQDFVVHCLQPWATKIAEELTSKLFTTSEIKNRRRYFAFDLTPLRMGDMVAQGSFFGSVLQNGIMTPNEIRRKYLNMNAIDGGDKLYIQQNMAPMDALEEIVKGKNGQVQETQTETPKQKTNTNDNEQPSAAPAN